MNDCFYRILLLTLLVFVLPATGWGYGPDAPYGPYGPYGYSGPGGFPGPEGYPGHRPPRGMQRQGRVHITTGRDGDDYVVMIHLNGMNPEDLEVEVFRGRLMVWTTREKGSSQQDSGGYEYRRSWSSYTRNIGIPRGVDAGQMSKEIRDDAIVVTFPMRYFGSPYSGPQGQP